MTNIQFDLTKRGGKIKMLNCVNNGPVEGGVRELPNNFDAYKAAKFPFARNHDAALCNYPNREHLVDTHRIFKNFDADVNDPASYVFVPTDIHLQLTVDAGTKPFYRLGPSIEHYYKDGTYPPKDYIKWAQICEHIIMHYNEGWADGFHWGLEYWEIWCEPDVKNADGSRPMWQGTEDEFNEFFSVAIRYLKNRFPNLKFGGPGFARAVGKPFFDTFFTHMRETNAPLDFYSWHRYTDNPEDLEKHIRGAREMADRYGYTNTESILDEFNYNAGVMYGETFQKTIAAIDSVKGASYTAAAMAVGQATPLDMLMYYGTQPHPLFNGLFKYPNYEKKKTYYIFEMFRDLRELGTSMDVSYSCENIYSVGATDNSGTCAFMLTYFDNNDDAEAKDIALEFVGNGSKVKVSYYLLDENHDNQLMREEIFTADTFRAYLKMNLYTTYFIKVEKI